MEKLDKILVVHFLTGRKIEPYSSIKELKEDIQKGYTVYKICKFRYNLHPFCNSWLLCKACEMMNK